MDNGFDKDPLGSDYGFDFYDDIVVSDAKKDFSRTFLALFLFTLLANVTAILIELVLMIALGTDGAAKLYENVYFTAIMGTLPMYVVGLPVIWLMIRKIPKRIDMGRDGLSAKEFIALIPISSLLSAAGNIVGNTLNNFFSVILDKEIVNSTDELISKMPIWLIIVLVVVIAPIVEEFIFRKLLLDRLSRYGAVLSIVVTSLAFGAFHGNFYQFFYTTLVGLVLGYVAYKSGNWLYSVLMHAIFNFIGGVLPALVMEHLEAVMKLMEEMEPGTEPNLEAAGPSLLYSALYLVFTYGLIIIGAVLVSLIISRRDYRIKLGDCEVSLPKRRIFTTVTLNVGFILFAIISAITFAISILI